MYKFKDERRLPPVWLRGLACGLLMPACAAIAQVPNAAEQEFVRQQERERALREREEAMPDVRLEADVQALPSRLPQDETPCFPIQRIVLEGEQAQRFGWALAAADPADDAATGRCLGTAGIDMVMRRVQNAIVERGYVTTRVLAAPQDLKGGTLALTVVPGRIRAIRFAEEGAAPTALWNAVPARPGELLNLRDIEQALENLQRVPTVTADIQIVPAEGDGAEPGQSDLVIAWQQRSRYRVNVGLDDGGSRSTGRVQANATLSLDGLLRANDLFYASVGDGVLNGSGKDSSSWTAHYDIPVKHWLLGATASDYDYRQAVAGAFETYVYSGGSRNAELRAARLLHRNATAKTGAYARGWWRESDNFVDDTEVEVQRRRMAGWELGLTHKHFVGEATLDLSAAYRRGTGAFDALRAPEELFDEGTSRSKVISADAQLSIPFRLGEQPLRYTGAWRAQWNRTRLVPQDRFALGGRYTVRGFDGEVTVTGDRGWLLRNELGVSLGGGQEFYVAADYGHVGGPSNIGQLTDHLAGMALGLRGGYRRAYWDVFVGAPLVKPAGYPTAFTTTGFSVGASF